MGRHCISVTGLCVPGMDVGLTASLTLGTCDDTKLAIPNGIDTGLNDSLSSGLNVRFPAVGFPVTVGLKLG